MHPLLTTDERLNRVRENILAFRVPQLPPHNPAIKRRVISICGYGPSLGDTWGATIDPVMTTSGAHDFLLAKGVVPKYHCEMDPREYKGWLIDQPHPDCTYLINSICHPKTFERLLSRGANVVMWHSYRDDDAEREIALVESLLPGTRLMAGGTSIGSRAVVVAREIGHTHFELHGMDCCYRGAQQWAGSHYAQRHKTVRVEVQGEQFETSDLLMQSTDDFFNVMRMMPGCRFRVHGGGLLEARMKLLNRDPVRACSPGWWRPVNFTLRAAA